MTEYLYVLQNPETENHTQLLCKFWASLVIRVHALHVAQLAPACRNFTTQYLPHHICINTDPTVKIYAQTLYTSQTL